MAYGNLKLKVGIFILILLINLSGVVTYILVKKGIFEKKYNYHFITYTAESFTVGMPVKVSGFAIGYVDEIKLQDNGEVKVTFSVNKENQKWLAQESLLMVRKPLLGSSYIILYSAIGNPVLKEGTELNHILSNDINDLVLKLEPIVVKLGNIVNSVDKITTYLSQDDSELMKIIKNLEKFSATLANNKSILTSITGDKKATDSFIKSINKLYDLINNFSKVGSNVNKDVLPQVVSLIEELNLIAKDIQEKLKSLDSVVNSVSNSDKDIVEIKKQIKTGMSKTNNIIEKVDNLFKSDDNEKVNLP